MLADGKRRNQAKFALFYIDQLLRHTYVSGRCVFVQQTGAISNRKTGDDYIAYHGDDYLLVHADSFAGKCQNIQKKVRYRYMRIVFPMA